MFGRQRAERHEVGVDLLDAARLLGDRGGPLPRHRVGAAGERLRPIAAAADVHPGAVLPGRQAVDAHSGHPIGSAAGFALARARPALAGGVRVCGRAACTRLAASDAAVIRH